MGATQSTTSFCELKTAKGSLRGIQLSDRSGRPVCQRYTGIPYAKPPVGPLRWRRPQELPGSFSFSKSATEPGDYTNFGPVCPQPVIPLGKTLVDNPDAAPPIVNVQSEDCLYLNIWVPCGRPPPGGYPVQVHLHGGWLQVGHAMQGHAEDPFDLLRLTKYPRIIVSPTYRLNLLGFLTGPVLADLAEDEAPGNYGFWDQRLALEWIAANIALFSGNPDNMTLGGLSAGANSTLFQLHYDVRRPSSQRLVKRIYLWSNAVGIQPNSTNSAASRSQFDGLCQALGVSLALSAREKMARLRALPWQALISVIPKLEMHTFRSSTDECFIPSDFLASIHDGSFTTQLAERGISVLLGEVAHESRLYRLVHAPSDLDGLKLQLNNYYPKPVVKALLRHYPLPDPSSSASDYSAVYARILGDCQVHAVVRGFVHCLLHPPPPAAGQHRTKPLPTTNLHRYRIAWRAPGLDAWIDPALGVTHGSDAVVWWLSGVRAGWTPADVDRALRFTEPFGRFVAGDDMADARVDALRHLRLPDGERLVRVLDERGQVSLTQDEPRTWQTGMEVWRCLWDAQKDDEEQGGKVRL